MGMVRLGIEITATIVGSLVVYWLIDSPRAYFVSGAVLSFALGALIVSTRPRTKVDPLLEDHAAPLWLRILYGLVSFGLLGIAWPTFPIVIAFRRGAGGADGGPPDSVPPSSPGVRSPAR